MVVFDGKTTKKGGYYEGVTEVNPYIESAEKFQLLEFLKDFMDKHEDAKWAYLQGETFGKNIQKRDYGLDGTTFEAFTFVESERPRYSYVETKRMLDDYDIPTVPILGTGVTIPDTSDDVMAMAPGTTVGYDAGMREGIVFRSDKNPQFSFKAVDPEYLLAFHG